MQGFVSGLFPTSLSGSFQEPIISVFYRFCDRIRPQMISNLSHLALQLPSSQLYLIKLQHCVKRFIRKIKVVESYMRSVELLKPRVE
ncbi:hypothetical protein L2E82_36412 [Cichorium intybus]|uniref:Uncharacterized protein n=1 Tax=Cichorium intybus TaxID=13427 RepID=A0ACB9BRU2_CICIN|nr:hypothetical protein L2E82_36412 [Cichorium intybus]